MSKDTFYFSHDYNARNDIKIKRLISKHGYLGFGIFWAIVEDLYNNANALPTDYDCIAYEFRTDEKVVFSVINDFELFIVKDGFFGSVSIENRINERNAKSIKARESANLRWNKNKIDANALPTQSECNAIKESKVKDINNFNVGQAPTKSIDFEKLRLFINDATGRNFQVINKTVQGKYIARLKEGYSKDQIIKAVVNACKDKNHIENGFKYLTPEFFSRADKIEMHGSEQTNKPITFTK